jgi:alpha-1,3-mannosyltransferase
MLFASSAEKSLGPLYCFNDSWYSLLIVLFIYFWIKERVIVSVIFYSLSVSVKMSGILYLPGLLLVSVFRYGILKTIKLIFGIILIQLITALPFLKANPTAYLSQAYNVTRKFD